MDILYLLFFFLSVWNDRAVAMTSLGGDGMTSPSINQNVTIALTGLWWDKIIDFTP